MRYFLLSLAILGLVCPPLAAAQNTDTVVKSDVPSAPSAGGERLQPDAVLDSIEVSDMDIGDVLKLIMLKTNFNITATENVRGKVTVHLKAIDARDALRIILEPLGLALIQDGNAIRVMTAVEYERETGTGFTDKIRTVSLPLTNLRAADAMSRLAGQKSPTGKIFIPEGENRLILMDTPEAVQAMAAVVKAIDVPVQTRGFLLKNVKVQETVDKVKTMLTPQVGESRWDEDQKTLTVTDTPQKLAAIQALIDTLRRKSVLVEVKVIEIVLDDEHFSGVDWEAIVSNYHSLVLKKGVVATDQNKTGVLSLGTISNDDYPVLEDALDTVGVVDVLAGPDVTVSGQDGQQILAVSDLVSMSNPARKPAESGQHVDWSDFGTAFFAVPAADEDNGLVVKVRAVAEDAVNPSEISVKAPEDMTVVIGGLIKEERVKKTHKIPLLGDLPFVGVTFRIRNQEIRRTEYVIFLTPKFAAPDQDQGSAPPADASAGAKVSSSL